MAKKFEGVQELIKGELYKINYQVNGIRRFYRIEASSSKEAYIVRLKEMDKQRPDMKAQATSFSELKKHLVLICQADGNSPKTIYGNLISKFSNFYEVFLPKYYPHITNIDQLTSEIIEHYKQFVVIEQGREKGWRDELTKQRTMASKFVKRGYCSKEIYDNAFCGVKKPKRTQRLYREITRAQMKTLLDHIEEHRPDYYGITYMIMRLGWRRGQVLSIKRRNIKVNGFKPIEIICEPQDTKTKEPFVFKNIDEELAKVVMKYLWDKHKTEWLFPNSSNRKHHANHYSSWIKSTAKEILGIELTPHDFRHNFITKRLNEGSTPRDIMAVTGHKDIDSFNIYTHATSSGTKEVLKNSRLF
jgi:integrase